MAINQISSSAGQARGMAGSFQPIHLYDAPGVALAQFLESEAGFTSIKNTFLSPENLSPAERSTLAEKFVNAQSGKLAKTMAGIATDPWVWAAFLFSPIGAKALASGKSLFAVNKAFNKYNREYLGFAHNLRTSLEEFRGSNVAPITLGVAQDFERISHSATAVIAKEREALFNKFDEMMGGEKRKWTTLIPEDYKDKAQRQIVQKFNDVVGVQRMGLDREQIRWVPEAQWDVETRTGHGEWVKFEEKIAPSQTIQGSHLETYTKKMKDDLQKFKDDFYKKESKSERRRYFDMYTDPVGGDVDIEAAAEHYARDKGWFQARGDVRLVKDNKMEEPAFLQQSIVKQMVDEFGPEGRAFIEKAKYVDRHAFVDYIGDMDHFLKTGEFKIDNDKLSRAADAMSPSLTMNELGVDGRMHIASHSIQGQELLMDILGNERVEALARVPGGGVRRDAMLKQLGEAINPDNWSNGDWLSRSNYNVVRVDMKGQMKTPILGLDSMESGNVNFAPKTATRVSSKLAPLTSKELVIDPDFLERVQQYHPDILTNQGYKHMVDVRKRAQRLWVTENATGGRAIMGLDPSHEATRLKHLRNVHQATVYDTRMATEAMLDGDKVARAGIADEIKTRTTSIAGKSVRIIKEIPAELRKHVSPGMLMSRVYQGEHSAMRQELLRNIVAPGALNNAGDAAKVTYNNMLQSKALANWVGKKDGWISRTVESIGPKGVALMDRIREIGDFTNKERLNSFSGGLAKFFYVTHLGVNMSSVVMNLMQPFTLAATVGRLDEVAGAMADSIGDMARYAEKRMAAGGMFISNDLKRKIMLESFPMMGSATGGRDVLGIGPDVLSTFDTHMVGMGDKLSDTMLKFFEKSEWYNRNFAAHLFKRISRRAGSVANPHYIEDMHHFVLTTQFGAQDLNTPVMFLKGPLSNPLLRQFLSFPLRTFMGVFDTFPRLGGETNYWKGLTTTLMRGMGMSALVYEAGKGLVGADLNRGLFISSSTQILGGDALSERKGEIVPIPPIFGAPLGVYRGVVNEDAGLLADSIARLVPGGVALNRLLSIAPPLPSTSLAGLPGVLQKTYARYDQPLPTGEVPVFKGDGTLVEFQKPSELIFKGLGVDLGKWRKQGELDNYLVKQRQEFIQSRHEYLRAMAANEPGRAGAVARAHEKKFKVPLTVTKEQVAQFLNNQTRTRTERAIDRIPVEVRSQYAQMAEGSSGARNLPPGSLTEEATAKQRDMERMGMEQQLKNEELMRRIQAVGPGATKGGTFSSFGGF